jgi:hypothetical protein
VLGRGDEAQGARWSCFERALSAEHLRAFRRLRYAWSLRRPAEGRARPKERFLGLYFMKPSKAAKFILRNASMTVDMNELDL